jgi:hypothetical protein
MTMNEAVEISPSLQPKSGCRKPPIRPARAARPFPLIEVGSSQTGKIEIAALRGITPSFALLADSKGR